MTLKESLKRPHIIVGDRTEPTCGRKDCDIEENPSHWVDVELTPGAQHAIDMLPEVMAALEDAGEAIKALMKTTISAVPTSRPRSSQESQKSAGLEREGMNHVININPLGRLSTIFTDQLPLGKLGRLEVTRASHVEFNPATQAWEVEWANEPGKVVFSDPDRGKCIDWEVEQLDRDLRNPIPGTATKLAAE